MRPLSIVFILFLSFPVLAAAPSFEDSWKNDRRVLQIYRSHLADVRDYLQGLKDPSQKMLSGTQKDDLRGTWRSFQDDLQALDALGRTYALPETKDEAVRQKSLVTADWIFLTQYRYALECFQALDRIPGADTFLNEEDERTGTPKGSLAALKFRFLNVERAADFLAHNLHWKGADPWKDSVEERQMKEDRKVVLGFGLAPGPLMTAKNGAHILQKGSLEAWFPVQKGVAEWMGKTKVYREGQSLISPDQAEELKGKLEPGDMLFTRHEWYLSNAGLPGFWCHAALYMGDATVRKSYFNDPQVRAWVASQGLRGGFEDLLRSKLKAKYQASLAGNGAGQVLRVIEAVGEGVKFSSLGHFADADSLCALRPRLSKVEKAIALYRAFRYVGRPYDFDFDFQSDATLVCSEVVYKAYEASPEHPGVKFPLQRMLGRMVSSPNGMVEQFDRDYATPAQQEDFVAFLNGHELEKASQWADVKALRQSWRWPKWHVLVEK